MSNTAQQLQKRLSALEKELQFLKPLVETLIQENDSLKEQLSKIKYAPNPDITIHDAFSAVICEKTGQKAYITRVQGSLPRYSEPFYESNKKLSIFSGMTFKEFNSKRLYTDFCKSETAFAIVSIIAKHNGIFVNDSTEFFPTKESINSYNKAIQKFTKIIKFV